MWPEHLARRPPLLLARNANACALARARGATPDHLAARVGSRLARRCEKAMVVRSPYVLNLRRDYTRVRRNGSRNTRLFTHSLQCIATQLPAAPRAGAVTQNTAPCVDRMGESSVLTRFTSRALTFARPSSLTPRRSVQHRPRSTPLASIVIRIGRMACLLACCKSSRPRRLQVRHAASSRRSPNAVRRVASQRSARRGAVSCVRAWALACLLETPRGAFLFQCAGAMSRPVCTMARHAAFAVAFAVFSILPPNTQYSPALRLFPPFLPPFTQHTRQRCTTRDTYPRILLEHFPFHSLRTDRQTVAQKTNLQDINLEDRNRTISQIYRAHNTP